MIRESKAHQISLSGILLAMLMVCSQIALPIGLVPITLQTFAVALIGTLLKPSRSLVVISSYLILGILGLPVFAHFGSGSAVLIGPTGGYLIGFISQVYLTGLLLRYLPLNWYGLLASNLMGMLSQLLCGSLWLCLTLQLDLKTALLTGMLPYLGIEIGKIFLVVISVKRLTTVSER